MALPEGYKFPDVSRYRRVEDWGTYGRAYPISACKATEGGSHKDPYFPAWRAQMRSRGLLPICYHFLRRNVGIKEQVKNFLETADDGGTFIVMLDIETAGDGSNPTIGQADNWYDMVRAETGIPRSRMLTYMPRWWFQAHGNGSTALADTILWNSHFSRSPDISGFAGDRVQIIQYSSTAPIVGLASPGSGDMNVAINHTIESFLGLVKGQPRPPEAPDMDVTQNRLLRELHEALVTKDLAGKPVAKIQAPAYFAKSIESEAAGKVLYVDAGHQSAVELAIGGPLHEWIKGLHLLAGLPVKAVMVDNEVLLNLPDA